MGGVRLHAGVRGGADHRREPRRQVRPQAPVPVRRRAVRAGQPGRRAVRVRRRADRRPGRPGRRGRRHGAAGAGHVPGHLRPGGAGQGVRHLRGDARLRVRDRAGPRRRADRREPVRLGLALGVLRERAGGRGRADRRRPPRARDQGPGRAAAEPARRGAAGRLAGRDRLPAARGPSARLARVGVAADGGRGGRPGGARADRGPAVPAFRSGRGSAAAGRAVPGAGVRRRDGRAARLLRRDAGLLPRLRAVAAGRRALLAAEGRA